MAGGELRREQRVAERQRRACRSPRRWRGCASPSPSMTATRSPTRACAASARWRPSAIASPCSAASEPAVTPTSSPPPCPPSRIWAGMTSSETPRLGPSVVGVSATAERTPRVARASASAAAGSPGPLLVTARSPDSAGVPLLGDGVVDGRGAEQQRAAHGDGEHQRRAGGREAARGGAEVRGRQEAADRRERGRAAGPAAWRRRGPRSVPGSRPPARGRSRSSPTSPRPCPAAVVVAETANSGHRAGEREQPADHAPRAEQPRLDRGVGERDASAARGRRAAPAAEHREQRDRDSAGDGRGGRQPAGLDGEVRRDDAVAHEPVGEPSPSTAPGQTPAAEPDAGRRSPPPTRSCGGSGRASRRPLAAARSRARAAGSRGPSCSPRRTSR